MALKPPVSPLAPKSVTESSPSLPPVAGVRLAAGACGLRYKGRTDLMVCELAEGTQVAGVFTRSKTASAPVLRCREHLATGTARALVVNSGNANAFTGGVGERSVDQVTNKAAELFKCAPASVFTASTGVIGEALDDGKITNMLGEMALQLSDDAWTDAALAIMTTDTFPKAVTRKTQISGKPVTINAIAKGSGMIMPDMATMLSFVFTDADIGNDVLQALLEKAVEPSFNSITVDSDTSTSDTVLMFATAKAGNARPQSPSDEALDDFEDALASALLELAQLIVRDGEGASKFIAITVTGAENDVAAKRIALSIANSPLVKTAIAAEDANWGRIVMAVGKAGEAADRDKLLINIGGTVITEAGKVVEDYDEGPVATHMKGDEIDIMVDIGIGNGAWTVWTCDLTHGYIDINASYRS